MTKTKRQQVDGLWAAGLSRRTRPTSSAEPRCVDCRDTSPGPIPADELTLLWRRGKSFRRHRTYR